MDTTKPLPPALGGVPRTHTQNTGSGLVYRRLQAERDGYRIKTFTALDDLPDHARTKFEMMERAANANETIARKPNAMGA